MIISLSIGAGGGGAKTISDGLFLLLERKNPECFSRNIEANWRGGGVGQDDDIYNANIPLPSLFTEKLVLLRVEVDGNA